MRTNYNFISREVVNGTYDQYITKTSIRTYEHITVTTKFVFDECELNISIRKRDYEECVVEFEIAPNKIMHIETDVPESNRFKVEIDDEDLNILGYLHFNDNECYYEGKPIVL